MSNRIRLNSMTDIEWLDEERLFDDMVKRTPKFKEVRDNTYLHFNNPSKATKQRIRKLFV